MASLPERMIGSMRGDVKTFQEIEADQNALGQAMIVIVIAAVASMLGNIFRNGIGLGLFALVTSLISYAIWTLVIVLVGTKLMPEPNTKADFVEAFRVIGFTASPGVFGILAIIPFLGPFLQFPISIWMLVIGVIAVREVLDYSSTGRAVLVCVIAWFVCFVVMLMIAIPLAFLRAIAG